MKDWRKSPEPRSMMGAGNDAVTSECQPFDVAALFTTASVPNDPKSPVSSLSCSEAASAQSETFGRSSNAESTTEGVSNSTLRSRPKLTLVEMARRVIIQKIHLYDSFGDAPFRLLRPILEQCTPRKLWSLEEESPLLIEETNYIWRRHCLRDFKDFKDIKPSRLYEDHTATSSAPLSMTHRWREVYRDKMVQDYEAKQAATEHVKQKYALLKASKEATQVRIVSEAPPMRRRLAGAAARQPYAQPTQGQRMLSKARRTAQTQAHAVRMPRSGVLSTSQAQGEHPCGSLHPAAFSMTTMSDSTAASDSSSSFPSAPDARRARTPPGFERKATMSAEDEQHEEHRAAKKTKLVSDAPKGTALESSGKLPSPRPTISASPNSPVTGHRGPHKRGISVTTRRVATVLARSSDRRM